MKINDDIPRLEAEERVRLDIDFDGVGIKRKGRFRFVIFILLILLALICAFIFKKSQNYLKNDEANDSAIEASASTPWHGAFESEEIFNYCREASVSVIAEGRQCSGFVYSSDGWIATVEGAVNENVKGQIEVVLFDGRSFFVESFRICREVGLILMKINAGSLRAVSFESDNTLLAGEELFTFCSVGGVYEGGSLFSGKVAHTQRIVELCASDGRVRLLRLFQIGILLTEEGVGAPLFNDRGELVGISCASNAENENNERYMVDYAIEASKVKNILKMMKNGERVEDNAFLEVVVE